MLDTIGHAAAFRSCGLVLALLSIGFARELSSLEDALATGAGEER